MTTALFGDIIGFVGAGLILAAYAYLTFGTRGANLAYYLLNLAGAVTLGISLVIHFNLASLCLEIAWAAIAIAGIARTMRRTA